MLSGESLGTRVSGLPFPSLPYSPVPMADTVKAVVPSRSSCQRRAILDLCPAGTRPGQSIAFGASGETGVQTLTAPGSEQGTRSKEAPQVSLTVFWSPPLRVSSFGSELCLRVAIEIWGPKLEKTRMSAHPLPDGNQDSDPAWLLGFEKGGRGSKLHEQLSS